MSSENYIMPYIERIQARHAILGYEMGLYINYNSYSF